MQFQIRTILIVTAFLACLFATLKIWPAVFVVLLLLIHFGIVVLPVAIVFVAILCGRQVDNRLEVQGNPIVGTVILSWLFCVVTAFVFWIFVSASAMFLLVNL